MNQNLYEKHRLMKFRYIEFIVPTIIAVIFLISVGLAYLFEWNRMAFNAVGIMIVVCVLYKIICFFLNLWEYNNGNDMSKN